MRTGSKRKGVCFQAEEHITSIKYFRSFDEPSSKGLTPQQLEEVIARVKEEGLDVHLSVGEGTTIVGVIGMPIRESLKSVA